MTEHRLNALLSADGKTALSELQTMHATGNRLAGQTSMVNRALLVCAELYRAKQSGADIYIRKADGSLTKLVLL